MVRDTGLEMAEENIANLEKKVEQEEKKYNRIIDFINKATEEIGELTKYITHDYNTEERRELKLENLILISDTGHHWMGGNTAEIMYNGISVLNLYYQVPGDTPKVSITPGEWESKLESMMNDPEKFFEAYKQKHADELNQKKACGQKLVDSDRKVWEDIYNSAKEEKDNRDPEQIEIVRRYDDIAKKRKEVNEKAKKLGLETL